MSDPQDTRSLMERVRAYLTTPITDVSGRSKGYEGFLRDASLLADEAERLAAQLHQQIYDERNAHSKELAEHRGHIAVGSRQIAQQAAEITRLREALEKPEIQAAGLRALLKQKDVHISELEQERDELETVVVAAQEALSAASVEPGGDGALAPGIAWLAGHISSLESALKEAREALEDIATDQCEYANPCNAPGKARSALASISSALPEDK